MSYWFPLSSKQLEALKRTRGGGRLYVPEDIAPTTESTDGPAPTEEEKSDATPSVERATVPPSTPEPNLVVGETVATPSTEQNQATSQLIAFWQAIYGDGTGYLALASGVRNGRLEAVRERFFVWPGEAGLALAWVLAEAADGREVYHCAHLLTQARRIKENAAPLWSLYADLDHNRIPKGSPEPSNVVESSPNRWQAYWLLTRSIDPQEGEALNRRLAVASEADPSGADLTQLLRTPGTINHRYAENPEVRIVSQTGRRYDPNDLAVALPQLPVQSGEAHSSTGEDEPPVRLSAEGLRVWRGEDMPMKADGAVDRSGALYKIGAVLWETGASKSIIATALGERDATLGYHKYEERPDEYARIVEKVADCPTRTMQLSEGVTAAQLMAMDLPEPRFIVEGLLAEGVTLLVGSPKKGKSTLALNIALAVAGGRPLWESDTLGMFASLGAFRTAKGGVLLLSLEDGKRRLGKRLRKMLGKEAAPESLHIFTDWKRADQGGLDDIDHWLTAHSKTLLVIVDVLARFRKPVMGDRNIYEADYAAMTGLHRLADKHHVAILVLHHTRKATAQDPLDMVSGTQGLAGAADAVLVFRRTPGTLEATLSLQSRDLDERDLAVRADPDRLVWDLVGRAQEIRLSGERQQILALLQEAGERMSPSKIARELEKNVSTVKNLLRKMVDAGEVSCIKGLYGLPEPGAS